MTLILGNNAKGKLLNLVNVGDTSVTLQLGQGALFPAVAAPNFFDAYLIDASKNFEQVRVTAHVSGSDSFTVLRAQGGTTQLSFAAGTSSFELRLTKESMSEFPQRGDMQANQPAFVTSVGGTGNAITLTPNPPVAAYVAGLKLRFVALANNTGAVTVNVSGLGAKNITKIGSVTLKSGYIKIGHLVEIVYDGTQFQLTSNQGEFESGTKMMFAQAAAPTGWTQVTDDSSINRLLRAVTTAGGGVGGSDDPTILLDVNVPAHTHTFSGTTGGQSASHTHGLTFADHVTPIYGGYSVIEGLSPAYPQIMGASVRYGEQLSTGNASSNHTHFIAGSTAVNAASAFWAPRYINMITCQKQ